MDALVTRCAILAAAVASLGAGYRTPNFIVEAPGPQMAKQIGDAAEKFRRELSVDWTGKQMPNWARPCPITANVANNLGAGGATSFVFENGEVFGWRMTIQGSLVRILDSVLPHEVTHTVFATHFRQPLPRWADEGACTTVEHANERAKQQKMLISFLRTGRGIPFSRMFAMREYPRDVMPLYSQGYSLARFLVSQGGKRKFLNYLSDGLQDDNWTRATKAHYGFDDLRTLQENWLAWVKKGSPALNPGGDTPPLVAVKGKPKSPGPGPAAPSVYDVASTAGAKSKSLAPAGGDAWRARGSAKGQLAQLDAAAQPGKPAAGPSGPLAGPQHQVTRPQGFQRPRQVILEWSRPPGSDSSSTAAVKLPGPR